MNRFLINVILGGYGIKFIGIGKFMEIIGIYIEIDVLLVVEMIIEVRNIIIILGYGFCVVKV